MRKNIRVAVLCYRYESTPEKNLKKMEGLLAQLDRPDFVLLPEDSHDPDCLNPERLDGPFTAWLGEQARKLNANIIGNFTARDGSRLYDTCAVVGRSGKLAGAYHKIQLSHSDKRTRRLSPGNRLPVFRLDGVDFGVCICYDTWYPEIIRSLALNGAKLIFAPFKEEAAFIRYVRVLAQARAIENVLPMVCCGGGGQSARFGIEAQNFAFFVGPDGSMVLECTENPLCEYCYEDIDASIRAEKASKNWERPFDRVRGEGFL